MSESRQEALDIIRRAESHGIVRDPHTYSFIVVYPAPLSLEKITSDGTRNRIQSAPTWALEEENQVYDHNPMCTGHCVGCSFATQKGSQDSTTNELIDRIQEAKRKELDIYLKHTNLGQRRVNSILFGGGTPTFLEASQLGAQVEHYRRNLYLEPDCEITIEAAPETVDLAKLRELHNHGFNRLSIGFQELDDVVLKLLGRRHTGKEAIESYYQARGACFDRINIDLMYGLMDQNLGGWIRTIDRIIELRPDYITIYYYRREKDVRGQPYNFPSKEEGLYMYFEAVDRIIDAGYIQIASDQFALPDVEFRHQHKKWHRGSEYLGLGNSAYSFFNGVVYYNVRDLASYFGSISQGTLPLWIGQIIGGEEEAYRDVADLITTRAIMPATGSSRRRITENLQTIVDEAFLFDAYEELMRRTVIFGLKTSGINNLNGGIDLGFYFERFGIDLFETPVIKDEIHKLHVLGLLETSSGYTRFTHAGLAIVEEVCQSLYSPKVKAKLAQVGDRFGRAGL